MRDETPTLQIRIGETEVRSYSYNRAPAFIDLVGVAWAAIDGKGEWEAPFLVGGTLDEYLDAIGLSEGDRVVYHGPTMRYTIERHGDLNGEASSLVSID